MRDRACAGNQNDTRSVSERIRKRNVTIALDDYVICDVELLERRGERSLLDLTTNASYSSHEHLDDLLSKFKG